MSRSCPCRWLGDQTADGMSCPLRRREYLFIGSLVVLPQAAADMMSTMEGTMELLFVGDDWAEEHHDVELQDETGRVLGTAKLPEGAAGIARLHVMIGEHLGDDEPATVVVGIETDRGGWVQALVAAGYQIYAVNPLQVARYRESHSVSGAKSDTRDAHTLADMVRTDRHQLRPVAGDSVEAEAVKVVTRAHKTLIWERIRHLLRLRNALREFFPAALAAFDDLDENSAASPA
jgi:transposase